MIRTTYTQQGRLLMADDFYPFVDSGDPAPDNRHITGAAEEELPGARGQENAQSAAQAEGVESTVYATRISIYDDLFSTPRILVIQPSDPRTYLEEVTNTVYRCMKEQGGSLPLMIIRELVENFIHAHFTEPIVSILDDGNTIRFADLGPGITDKERAFDFGVTSADRSMKRYIRGTGAGLPMVQQYLEHAGGAVSIEDNLGCGTVVTVSVDAARVREIESHARRGAAVRGPAFTSEEAALAARGGAGAAAMVGAAVPGMAPQQAALGAMPGAAAGGMPAQAEGTVPGGYPNTMPYQQVPGWYPWQGYPAAGEAQAAMAGAYPNVAFTGAAPGYAPAYAGMPTQPAMQGAPTAAGWPAMSMTPQAVPGAQQAVASAAPAAAQPFVDERGAQALTYIADNGQGGPTDLVNTFGSSAPTWSRALAQLSSLGLAEKHGRKYTLSERGASWVADHRGNPR